MPDQGGAGAFIKRGHLRANCAKKSLKIYDERRRAIHEETQILTYVLVWVRRGPACM